MQNILIVPVMQHGCRAKPQLVAIATILSKTFEIHFLFMSAILSTVTVTFFQKETN